MKRDKALSAQSIVEVAILIPVVLFLLMGFFDLGRAVFYYSSISNAVREGARYGIVDANSDEGPYLDNITEINDYTFGIADVSVSPTDSSCYPGPCVFQDATGEVIFTITRLEDVDGEYYERVRVEAMYLFTPVTPGIKQIFGSVEGIELSAQSTMRIAAASR